jgi:protein-tyrosine phosphatase
VPYPAPDVIDLHCHVLPGVDDGPATLEDAITLARSQVELGVTTIVATPHVSWDYPDVSAAIIDERVAELNAALEGAAVPVTVVAGAEVALTRAIDMSDEELGQLRLGAGPWLLVEPPFSPGAGGLEAAFSSLAHRGHRMVIAHPERCPSFLSDRSLLERLIAAGALSAITAGALVGRFGREPRRFALGLVADGLTHVVASDAHGVNPRRPPGLAEETHTVGPDGLVDWLCRAVPEAIITGAEIPERSLDLAPTPVGRGALLGRFFRRD